MIATKPSFVVLEVKACDMQRSGHAGLGFPDANSESPAALIHVSVDMCETCSGKCDESKRLRIERNTYMNVNSVCHTHTSYTFWPLNLEGSIHFMEQQASQPTEITVRNRALHWRTPEPLRFNFIDLHGFWLGRLKTISQQPKMPHATKVRGGIRPVIRSAGWVAMILYFEG